MDVNLKNKANDLRKAGKYNEALAIYDHLWQVDKDIYIGAGLLHCLRKLKIFDKAIIIADELIVFDSDVNWCQQEIVWTYIEGMLKPKIEKGEVHNVIEIANKILTLKPDSLAQTKTILKVLKVAKLENNWAV
ncbi:MAG: hypothetical protein Q7W05_12025, partial [Deltaproteobacteria bacterium]|nr:hypothetical protein [Deltaproteobacteria bacterium]